MIMEAIDVPKNQEGVRKTHPVELESGLSTSHRLRIPQPDVQLAQLLLVDRARRVREQALRALGLREGDHVADAFGAGHHRDDAVQAEGQAADEHSALAKAFCTVRMREAAGWARELLGGNGILLENHVGRFVADSEAIYSYEGTREINTLIVGRAITGLGAFV